MGLSGRGSDSNTERTDSGGPAHEVSEGNRDSTKNWIRFYSCYLAKNLGAFCPCHENLSEDEFKIMD